MLDFFRKLFASDFLPHGHCYLWNPGILWLNAVSDLVIAVSYYTIPILLCSFTRKRKDVTFHWVFLAFGAFILACGTTHLMSIWTIWYPTYRLDGVIKALTAIISITTAALLFPLLPTLVRLRTPTQLAHANETLANEIALRKTMGTLLERQAGLLELAHDALIVRDLKGEIRFWNRGAEQLYGWPRALAVGRLKHELLQPGFPKPLEESQHELTETGSWEGELLHRKRDGSPIVVSSRCALRRTDDHAIEVLEINRDLTEQKAYEEKLGREVMERRRAEEMLRFKSALHEKNIELEKADRAKNRFLATISHELRTPLNAIIGFTGTLLMRLPGPLTPDQEKQLRTVRTSGRHLLSLINDLLDLAKIESGKIELRRESVDCGEVLKEVATYLRPIAESKDIVLSIDTPSNDIVVQTDRRALHQILLNLANNAVKFTQSGSVRLELSENHLDRESRVIFSVIDTGVGIRPEDHNKLFQAFSQVTTFRAQYDQGTGLGLHLSRKLAELLPGQITFESELGKGSTFRLTLGRR